MKKFFALFLVFAMLFSVGCGSSESPLAGVATGGSGDMIDGTPGSVTLTNNTAYTFVELYSTASTSTEFGAELLGGTRIDPATSVSLDLGNINLTQDLWIVDNDGDSYSFFAMQLTDGGTLSIELVESGGGVAPVANLYDTSGQMVQSITGTLVANADADATGYNSNGSYSFVMNNNSDYDIYSVHVGIANASSAFDLDLLPEILPANTSLEIKGFASQGDWLNTEWTLYITDVDGDTSASFDYFNPWTVSAVDVTWDGNSGGYVTQFIY